MRSPLALQVRSLCVLAAAALWLAGCHLFTDYGPPRESDADTGPPDAVDAMDAGRDTMRDTGRDAVDSRDADADVDVEPDLGPNQCAPAFSAKNSYRVQRASNDEPPQIDGECSEAEFDTRDAYEIRFSPPGTTDSEPTNSSSDNTGSCYLRWVPGESDQLHGCCEISDGDLGAVTKASDPPRDIYQNGDDRVEYWLKCDTRLERSSNCSYKHFFSVFPVSGQSTEGEPTTAEGVHRPGSGIDFSAWEPSKEARIRETSDGYVLEWSAEIGFEVSNGDTRRCQVAVYDTGGDESGVMYAFGDGINDPPEWGCCFFE